ncbi:hypothetical protein J3B02_002677 [Coemansia erecta]|nr:hypothetical protein J3B02_002677 [Coemansia erecta]KAJ2856788.1 hypothetical protein FB639_006068 [Coemansia asiatica]
MYATIDTNVLPSATELPTDPQPETDNRSHSENSNPDNTHRDPEPSIPSPAVETHDILPTQVFTSTIDNTDTHTKSNSHGRPQPSKPSASASAQQTHQTSKVSMSASRHTVVAVMTVVVNGETSLSSHTTVIDDSTPTDISIENTDDKTSDLDDEIPYTSTIIEDGSAVVVTGMRVEESTPSDAQSLFAHATRSAFLVGSVAAIAIVALF